MGPKAWISGGVIGSVLIEIVILKNKSMFLICEMKYMCSLSHKLKKLYAVFPLPDNFDRLV